MKGEPSNIDNALCVEPFDGDYGDGEVRISDEIIDAPTCHICAGTIRAGTKVRRIVEWTNEYERDDDDVEFTPEVSTYLFCQPCCRAMAAGATSSDCLERREDLGEKRRAKRNQ